MNRAAKADLLRAALHMRRRALRLRMYDEVSIRQKAAFAPPPWAKTWHLDMVGLQTQRTDSRLPFMTHGFELKSCRQDFLSDSKWRNYIGRTDRLTLVGFEGDLSPEDVEGTGAGLMLLSLYMLESYNGAVVHYRPVWSDIVPAVRTEHMPDEVRYDTMYGIAINRRKEKDWDKLFQKLARDAPRRVVDK